MVARGHASDNQSAAVVKAMATVIKDAERTAPHETQIRRKALANGACNALDGVNGGQSALSGLLIAFPALALAVFK